MGALWVELINQIRSIILQVILHLTLIHEVGHAVGLDHPHDGAFVEVASPGKSNQNTVMSYFSYSATDRPGGYTDTDGAKMGYSPQTWMIDDIAALQYMYGTNELTNRTDDVYDIGNLSNSSISDGIIYQTIWDAAGNDTISWAGQTTDSSINLNPGTHSFFGKISSIADTDFNNGNDNLGIGDGILGIAHGADIENAIGGVASDVIVGNSLNNVLYGGTGANILDTLTGGNGADVFQINAGTDGTSVVQASAGSPANMNWGMEFTKDGVLITMPTSIAINFSWRCCYANRNSS
jgi:serralysin